ncbi:hypothetical protein ABEB36_001732 [Hypothenemus hampei]|uniref:AAA+ ATPase domain-containing protein n=1 Tax=Hypothenemus hampei TaxID=57062 RepID=A0ABD1FI44_HYPHA
MGKITAPAVEIIPLNENKNNKLVNMSYMSDPSIVPRVKKYLESNIHKTYVDINQMADDLQKEYREYSRRKKSAFRASVKKAYSTVLQSYGLEDKDSSDEALVSDDSEQESETEDKFGENSMNNALIDLYQRQAMKSKPKIMENELIDISSEDSEEEATCSNTKSSNGVVAASTSQRPVVNSDPPSEGPSRKRKLEAMALPVKNASKKKKTSQEPFRDQTISFKNIGGMKETLEEVCQLSLHIVHPEIYYKLEVSRPKGFLLHGPPGCGKTLLANALAGELGVQLIKINAPKLMTGISIDSEERIRELFQRSYNAAPCVLFVDEIDAITSNRQSTQKEMERRIVAQFVSCLDDLTSSKNGDQVLVIGATNRPEAIHPSVRRAGRFDREICLGNPDVKDREDIIRVLSADLPLSLDFDYQKIAQYTPGYVGADLLSLIREAGMVAVKRIVVFINTLKEQKKIEHALATQRAMEEAKLAKKALEEAKKEEEIIVDNEVVKDKELESTTNASVVLLDDNEESPKEAEAGTSSSNNFQPNFLEIQGKPLKNGAQQQREVIEPDIIVEESQEPMPVDEISPKSTLQHLLSWIHDKTPINAEHFRDFYITMEDFALALKEVQSSVKHEGFVTVPDITWNDVGSLNELREELQMFILAPVRKSEAFEAFGFQAPVGVLLCGPPGCGKTLSARAIANEAAINFISIKGPELLNMYMGENDKAVTMCFERARISAPCVLFFEELDVLCPKISDSREGEVMTRVVNQMLTEIDRLHSRKGVFLLAATNKPDIIDPAILQRGRFDKILYVGQPSSEDRVDILRAITKNGTRPKLDDDVDLRSLGTSEQLKGYTGADLVALVREASMMAFKEDMFAVASRHFLKAVAKIRPSISEKDQKYYEKLRQRYTAVPETPEEEEMEYA